MTPELREFLEAALESHQRFVGSPLCRGIDGVEELYDALFALLAHDAAPNPCFVYSNALALRYFESTWEAWLGTPSRYSAEALLRSEREEMLEKVKADGYFDGYRGIRISARGRRFKIEDALEWNVMEGDTPLGRAASIHRVLPIDP